MRVSFGFPIVGSRCSKFEVMVQRIMATFLEILTVLPVFVGYFPHLSFSRAKKLLVKLLKKKKKKNE